MAFGQKKTDGERVAKEITDKVSASKKVFIPYVKQSCLSTPKTFAFPRAVLTYTGFGKRPDLFKQAL